MEISKALQEEILSVQNKLKSAIRDHQICVEKLKDEPNNSTVLEQIQQIQLYIVSLGRRQKQVVQRLRKEVETLKAENANEAKVSVASLLGLNNNNHITNNNEVKRENSDSKGLQNIKGLDTRLKKDDYEEEIRNNVSPPDNDCSNPALSSSVESISYEDDVVEISQDENLSEKQDLEDEVFPADLESSRQVAFLGHLGLITTQKSTELLNRKQERKRRSTANPQFVYSNWEIPTKRKRYSYLQSAGNAPQTRQSTAKSNGPSPPPGKILSNKSIPSSTKNVSKSAISTQKSASRPNILRNASENKVLKSGTENGASQVQNSKSVGSKVVHIPGLPSSLTIERIESDTAVCINCRNPGTLTICQQCSSKYHVSCHSISPPPPKICPKCALDNKEIGAFHGIVKKENDLAAGANTTGVTGKAGEDSEVHKASRGFHQINAAAKRNELPSTYGFNQLPSSTFLIPLPRSPSPGIEQPDVKPISQSVRRDQSEIAFVNQQSQSGSIAYIQSESHTPSNYQLPVGHNKQQSYLIVKKVSETINIGERSENRQVRSVFNRQTEAQNLPILNYQLSSPCGYSTTHGEPEVPLYQSRSLFNKLPGRLSEPNASSRKKSNSRILPGLNRIVFPEDKVLELLDSSSDEEITHIPKKNVPRAGGFLDSLFAGNNKSDIVASGSGESQRLASGRANNTNNRQLSQVHESKSNERTEQLRCLQRSNSTDHVKLEEAHIPAPSRAKLDTNSGTRKKRVNSAVAISGNKVEKPAGKVKKNLKAQTGKKFSKDPKVRNDMKESKTEVPMVDLSTEAEPRPIMEVTLDDTDELESESQGESSKETDREIVKEEGKLITSSTGELSLVSADLQSFYITVKSNLDFIISERNHSSEQLQTVKESNIIELRTEVSVPDDKADVENQDLLSVNRRRLLSDEGIIPVFEKIVTSDRTGGSTLEIKETVVVNSLSDENIKVLEQYEAVMEVDKETAS